MAWANRADARAGTTLDREIPAGLEQIDLEMAHELGNSLTAVKVLVQLGLRNPAESASHARLASIEGEVTRMQDLLLRHVALVESIVYADAAAA
jgi:two-component system, NtrC family, sensor histidine kinase HydH